MYPYHPDSYHHHHHHRRRRHVHSLPIHRGPKVTESDFKGSWIHGPEEAGPSSEEIQNLYDEGAQPAKPHHRLEPEEAFGLLALALEDTKVTYLPCLESGKEHAYSKRNLPFMVFNDLDQMLFRSMLKGNVYLIWARLPPGMDGRTSRPGLKGGPRIMIELSSLSAQSRSHAHTLHVLLHQMTHAYYLQCCGFRSKGVKGKAYDLGHGSEYLALMKSIREHFLPGDEDLWRRPSHLDREARLHPCYYNIETGSSECCYVRRKYDRFQSELWPKAALALTLSREAYRKATEPEPRQYYPLPYDGTQRIETALQHYPYPQHSFFTLQWQDQIARIPKAETPHYQVLSQSPFFQNDLLLLPYDLDSTYFEMLHQFVCSGNYDPTLRQALQAIQASGTAVPHPIAGPPCILLSNARALPFLHKSILAYNLAKQLGFEPMALNALSRLDTLPFSAEDPIIILEYIYMPSTKHKPHTDIREWVRRWLAHQLLTTMGVHADFYKTNLGVLEQHPPTREKFMKLQYESQYLLEDAQYVRNHFPVSRGPQTAQTYQTPGLIDWYHNHTTTVQPTSSSVHGGPKYLALTNNPAWQSPEVPWFPPVEPSLTSGSSMGDPIEEQRQRDKQLFNDEIAEFERLNLGS